MLNESQIMTLLELEPWEAIEQRSRDRGTYPRQSGRTFWLIVQALVAAQSDPVVIIVPTIAVREYVKWHSILMWEKLSAKGYPLRHSLTIQVASITEQVQPAFLQGFEGIGFIDHSYFADVPS